MIFRNLSNIATILLLNVATFSSAFAQTDVLLDQNPPSVKWRQINTQNFKIIFPRDFESEAQRMANTMEHLYYPVSKTMGVQPKKLPIILQNQNAVSNGFVTVAPRRSEFYSMPPQDYNFLGTNDWLNLLAVHEYRHVVQYQRSQTGWFTKVANLAFGGDFWSLIANVGAPTWFWEGDAVATETALTKSGRGKIPNFDLAMRMNLLERGPFSYHKQYLGSFKDYVPNHYVTGYHMVTHVRRTAGEQVWPKVFTRTFHNPYIPFNFSRSMKIETGNSMIRTYKNMVKELDSLWSFQVENLQVTESSVANYRKNRVFTNYDYPQFTSDGRIVAQRSGLSNIAQFVYIDSLKKSRKIHTLGIQNESGMLSVGGDKIVWNEFRFSPRFSVKTYSVIKVYDLKKKTTRTITHKTRLNGSSISPDGNKIVSIENSTSGQNTIVVHEVKTKKELLRFSNPQNYFYAMPRWSDDGKHIVVLKNTDEGKTITQYTADGKQSIDLLPVSNENVGHPVQYKNYLFYNSPFSGIDNIYALDIETGNKYQVVSKKYAAYNPSISPDGQSIAFNNFTKYGMDVDVIPFDPQQWMPIEQVEDRNIKYYEPLIEQEGNLSILETVPEKEYEVKKYSQFSHLFNPYSVYPVFNQVDREFGVSLRSQNLLSTTYAALGFSFNGNEGTPRGFASISYQGFLPIFDIEAGVGGRSINLDEDGKNILDSIYTWTEKSVGVGIRIPLNLTTNKYYRSLSIGAKTNLTQVSNYDVPFRKISDYGDGELHTAEYSLSFSSLLKQAPRDVTSRWGLSGFAIYRHTPTNIDYTGYLLGAQGRILLPGLFRHHGLQIRGGYTEQDVSSNYRFPNPVFQPRGYGYTPHSEFINGSIDYKFPIWNADLHLGSIINFQRFKGKAFYDRGFGRTDGQNFNYESLGFELHTDFNIMRWLPLLEIGVRWSYIPKYGKNQFDLLLLQYDL